MPWLLLPQWPVRLLYHLLMLSLSTVRQVVSRCQHCGSDLTPEVKVMVALCEHPKPSHVWWEDRELGYRLSWYGHTEAHSHSIRHSLGLNYMWYRLEVWNREQGFQGRCRMRCAGRGVSEIWHRSTCLTEWQCPAPKQYLCSGLGVYTVATLC